ncbi:Nucleoporin SEH1 [Meyerozyma sp. JA9]|nr:Nucleoporin SEH1 [Meyerozyma sp. JA9]
MKSFVTGHEELVHDVQYDFYGKHIATVSSDQHIKVFDLDAATSSWVLNDSWKAHDSSVVKVTWAHPQFSSSSIIASCSYDRTVKVWQEQPQEMHGSGRRWVKLATLATESFGPIYDVKFAPSHLGLKLACIGSEGILRIYESVDPSNLTYWSLTAEIAVLSSQLPTKSLQSTFGIEWCPSKFANTEKFVVVALDQAFVYGASVAGNGDNSGTNNDFDMASGDGGINSENKYVRVCSLPEHNGLIRSVSWAPSMGRNFHLIATACKDGYVRIFKAIEAVNGDLKIDTIAKLRDHQSEVWRVTWNVTGTILSSAGDDGKVRLWKSNYLNEWKCMSIISSNAGVKQES